MGRTLNSYFPHDSNARNDRKMMRLRRVMGPEGYGIFFMIIEILREQPDFKYPLEGISELEFEFRISKEKILGVIQNFELFEIDNNKKFFSVSLVARLQPYLEKSARARTAANKRWDNARKLKEPDANAYPNAGANVDANRIEENRREKNMTEFEKFWDMYDKKIKRKRCISKWFKLTRGEKEIIFKTLPSYVTSTPDKQFRKHPITYLNNEGWEDEIIISKQDSIKQFIPLSERMENVN